MGADREGHWFTLAAQAVVKQVAETERKQRVIEAERDAQVARIREEQRVRTGSRCGLGDAHGVTHA